LADFRYLIIRFIICAIFFTMVSTVFSQIDSLTIRLAGVIYSDDSLQNTPYVHIINQRTGTGVISDSTGFFKTKLQKTDSLLFSCIGFKDKLFTLSDTITSTILFIKVKLAKTSYCLDVIDVLALSRINQFRYDFTHIPLLNNEWENQIIIPGVTKKNYKWIRDDEKFNPKQTLDGPISIIYYLLSDKGKSLRKYLELIENEEGDQIIDEKFNMELLSEYTGFTGDTLIDFKLYLNYTRRYLLGTNGYDIFMNIKNRLPGFKKNYTTDSTKNSNRLKPKLSDSEL